ncbi:MAG: ABC transporter substrate-binding protein [Nitrosomonas sp.]
MTSRNLIKNIVVLLLLAAIVFSLVSCQQKKITSATESGLRIGIEIEPERLNPLTAKNPQTFIVLMQIFEGLLGLDENGRVIPVIAESWETKDNGQTWLFHIRKNALFHESEIFGTQKTRNIDANDAAWSFTAICGPGTYASFVLADVIQGCADYGAGKAEVVDGIKVVDQYTLQFSLVKPEKFFPNRLTTGWMAILPKELEAPRNKDKWGLSMAVGSGPYELVSNTDSEVVLAANENYWDKQRIPKIKKLIYKVIKNDQLRYAELQKGGIDILLITTALLPTFMDGARKPKDEILKKFEVKETATFNTQFIGLNLNMMKDANLRRAMYFGVDRKLIAEKLLYGYADVTGGTIPPGINGYKPPFEIDQLFNQSKAREELSKSKYKGEEIELLIHDQAGSEQIGQIFQDQMGSIGIKIKLTKLDMNGVIGRILKGDAPAFSMYMDYVFSSAEPILLNLFPSSKRPIPNFWQYSNPDVDQALEGLRTLEHAASIARAAEIEAQIMNDVPAIFLFRQTNLFAHNKRLHNLQVNGHGHVMFERATLQ